MELSLAAHLTDAKTVGRCEFLGGKGESSGSVAKKQQIWLFLNTAVNLDAYSLLPLLPLIFFF